MCQAQLERGRVYSGSWSQRVWSMGTSSPKLGQSTTAVEPMWRPFFTSLQAGSVGTEGPVLTQGPYILQLNSTS